MNCGKLTAKPVDAGPVCFIGKGKKISPRNEYPLKQDASQSGHFEIRDDGSERIASRLKAVPQVCRRQVM